MRFKEGIEQGIEQVIVKLFKNGMSSITIAENLELSISNVKDVLERNNLNAND